MTNQEALFNVVAMPIRATLSAGRVSKMEAVAILVRLLAEVQPAGENRAGIATTIGAMLGAHGLEPEEAPAFLRAVADGMDLVLTSGA